MGTSYLSLNSRINIKTILTDVSALLFIYFIPAISHLIYLPLYYIEPMRLILILSFAHLSKNNTYLLALTLPVFSHIITVHPAFFKTILISFELLLCCILFYEFSKRYRSVFLVAISSIFISKVFYYVFKYLFVSYNLINSELVSTPVFMQIATTIAYSVYVSIILNKNKSKIFNSF